MGFFSTLKKIIDGKPLFEDEDKTDQKQQQTSQTNQSLDQVSQPQNNGRKIIPNLQIEHTEYHNNGDRMDVRMRIRNESGQEVELDKIRIIGMTRELDTHLRPRESRDFLVYSGKRPNNRSYDNVDINYKDMLGDYFQAKAKIEFRQEQDNTYSVYRVKIAGPVKDIE